MSKTVESRAKIEKKIKRRELSLKLLSLFAILILVAGLGVFIYFQSTDETRSQLADPTNIQIEELGSNYILSFSKVENASGYRIMINDTVQQVGESITSLDITSLVQKPQKYTVAVQALGNKDYKNSNLVYGNDLEVFKTLQMPIVQLDIYDSKLVWVKVDGADAYEVTTIINNDFSTAKSVRVTTTEFSIEDIVVDFTKTYSFTVKALSENEYINQSPSSIAVDQKLQGRLQNPENAVYDEANKELYWSPVENADTYTVVLMYGKDEIKKYVATTNSFKFPNADISKIGAYQTFVYANNVKDTVNGEIIWFLASEKSNIVDFSVYEKLAKPQNLKYQMNETLIWFTWNKVENARTYVVELLNDNLDKYFEYTAQTNEINIARNTLNGVFRVKVKANGYSYYLESDYSNILRVDAKDRVASVSNIEVVENGKYLTFTAPSTNVSGTLNIFAQNGYKVKIEEENPLDPSTAIYFEETIYSTVLNTAEIFKKATTYNIEIIVNGFSYFAESTPTTATYAHQIQYETPFNLQFVVQNGLKFYFSTNAHASNYTIDIGSTVIENIFNSQFASNITYIQDPDTLVYTYCVDYSEIWQQLYEYDPMQSARKYTAKVKAKGNTSSQTPNVAGYKDSTFSNVAIYLNKIKLATPEFIKVENLDEEEVLLYYSQVPNANSYLIELEGVSTGTKQVMTSRLTTVNIYDIISAGTNKIKITAKGTGYYLDSDPSIEAEYYYEAILKAPYDVIVVEEETESETKFYVEFTTTRFAEYYQVQIKQTHQLKNNLDGTKSVEELSNPQFVVLPNEYLPNVGKTKCDITDYLKTQTFGKFEVQVRAVLEQPEITEQPVIYSDWSTSAVYDYYDKQLAPTNLAFNSDTKTLTFDGVSTALNGYVVKVNYMLADGTYSSHEISTTSTSVDLTEEIASRGGVGEFVISAMTKRVDELFLRNSDWSSSISFQISITLSNPTNFEFREQFSEVKWVSDINMEYEHLKIEFSNSTITNLVIVEITDDSFFNSIFGLRNLLKQYGDGFYKFTVQSFSKKLLVNPSQKVEWTYTKYLQLNAPTLIEVIEKNDGVQATFTTVDNAKSYAVVAKLPTQTEWTYVVTNILDDGSDRISVDIKQGLANFLGANRYDIAVVAESYDYFQESERSNSLSFDLWLTFQAPSNLTVTKDENGTYFAEWSNVPYAVDYSFSVDSVTIDSKVVTNKYDLTQVLNGATTGHYLIGVRTNATGYYYKSVFTTYDFYLSKALLTPTLTYDSETYQLNINGQGDGVGYNVVVNYYENEEALSTGVATKEIVVEKYQSTILNLLTQMKVTGLGIYKIKVKELGDQIYWMDSEWSEEYTAYYTVPLQKLAMLNIDKRANGSEFDFYIMITKPSEAIYQNALVKYEFYEVNSINAEISENQESVLTLVSQENEVKIEGLDVAKYYVVKATILGVFDNREIYQNNLDTSVLSQTLKDLAYYVNSESTYANFATIGNLLGAPTITSVKMLSSKKLEITFNKAENANDYTLIVKRESKDEEIYNAKIDDANLNATINAENIVVTIDVIVSNFTDEYDIYNIVLFANAVVNDNQETIYGQSPNSEFKFEYITTLQAPAVTFAMQADNSLRISVANIEFATGYVFELNINGYLQEYQVGEEGYLMIGTPQYGKYVARAKAVGDTYHKDSPYGAYVEYTNSLTIAGVKEVRIIDNADGAIQATRIYAEWDAVTGAEKYGVKIDKDGVKIFEDETNKTYYDLINIFSRNGYATYTIWVKTNGDGAYLVGEATYTAYANYKYKGQFEIPNNLKIEMQEEPASLIYTVSFDYIYGAEEYVLSFYTNDGTKTLVKQLALNAEDLTLASAKVSGDITNFLKTMDGGEYLVTIKVSETAQNLASGESETIEFTNYHKHADPQLRIQQVGETPVLRLYFNNVDNAVGYKLSINGVPFLYDYSEAFAYPQGGFVEIYAGFLNIGQENIFSLTILGDETNYYLDSIYEITKDNFTFRLQEVNNIVVEQTSTTIIPNGTTSQVILTFDSVDFANTYQVFINGNEVDVSDLLVSRNGQIVYDLSTIFSDLLPLVDGYVFAIVAQDSVYGLLPSQASYLTFDYALNFTKPTNSALSSDLLLSWGVPENYDALAGLATQNSVTLEEQQYKINVYYTSSSTEQVVSENNLTTSRTFDLSTILTEAGGYRIEVYAYKNGPFGESINAGIVNYDLTTQLSAVTNVTIYQDGDKVRLSFDPIEKGNYQYAEQDIYYNIYLNDTLMLTLSDDVSTKGIDITGELWGGDNLVYIYTKDKDEKHFLQSPRSNVASYNFVKTFVAIFNGNVYNDELLNKQYLRFDRFTVNGLTDEEINNLTYSVSVINALTNQPIGSKNNMTAVVFNSSTMQIDVTEFVNGVPGTYEFSIKINELTKTITTTAGVVNFKMNESLESKVTYRHQLHAEILGLSLLVIDSEGNLRDEEEGLEMSEMWLSFDVNLSNEYVNQANELLYVVYMNQREYFLTIPFSSSSIGQTVTADVRMIGSALPVDFTTKVKITSYLSGGVEKLTLSVSLIELLQANGFNIYMTGVINIKAKSQEQGYYLESSYQNNFLVYNYKLKYLTPTGLELVTREDGLHYIKWNEPIHPYVNDYYRLVKEYNVTIYSEGIITESNKVINPHSTQGGKHSIDFTPENIIAESGYLYYNVENYLFAGHNTISLKCNASPENFYIESETTTISGQAFIKKLATPDFDIVDLEINRTGNDNSNKGVEIIITNYDAEDYDSELGRVVNYNVEALYRLQISSYSLGKGSEINPTTKTYMNYSIDFKVNRNGIVKVESGNEFVLYNKVRFTTESNAGRLRIQWTLAEPGEYTYKLNAIGSEVYYTSDSEVNEKTHQTTFNAPDLSFSVEVFHKQGVNDVIRPHTESTRISKITLNWQTELSYVYGASYTINIVGSFNKGQTTTAPELLGIVVTNNTTITFSENENAEIFEIIAKRPAYYTFSISSNILQAEVNAEAENQENATMIYYQAYIADGREAVEKKYNYQLKINTPEDMSVVELEVEKLGLRAFIKVKIPQYFIDARIQQSVSQIYVTYNILQLDPSFNLGTNKGAKSYSDSKASVYDADAIGAENGYYYVDITGKLFPGGNKITLSFNSILDQNFVQSDSADFEHNQVVTLDAIESISIENIYNENHYVIGMLFNFDNVEFNKYFAYILEIEGTDYNRTYSKKLLLKVDPNMYVKGSQENYKYVKCYDITNGLEQEVTLNNVFKRSVSGSNYVFSSFNYEEAQLPAKGSSAFAYQLAFAVLVDGGIPDLYNFKITTLGELNKNGTSNEYLNYSSLGQVTTTSSPNYFEYIMKGTLREADLQVGVMDGNNFVESPSNESNNHLAYIYNNDQNGASNSYVYLNYSGSGNANGEQKPANLMLKITLQDTQAEHYSLSIQNLSRRTKVNFVTFEEYADANISNMILAYDSAKSKYVATATGVKVSYVDGQWIAYVNLLELNGGAIANNGKYEIIVQAINQSQITNEIGELEPIYDATHINSTSRFIGRYDRLTTPEMQFIANLDPEDSTYGLFKVNNYLSIGNIVNTVNLSIERYNLVLQYALKDEDFSTSKQIILPYAQGKFNEEGAYIGTDNLLYIKESYIKSKLDERGVTLGTTKVRIYFDVEESGYIWDSQFSDGNTEFTYRAYINFMTFAENEYQYQNGSYSENEKTTQDIYSKNTFGINYRELATAVSIKYSQSSTIYVERQGWEVEVLVWYGTKQSLAVEWLVGIGDFEEKIFEYDRRSKTDSGLLYEVLDKAGVNITYNSYVLNMKISRIVDSRGNTVSSDQVLFDEYTYKKQVEVHAKLYAPVDIEMSFNEKEHKIYQTSVTFKESSIAGNFVGNLKLTLSYYCDGDYVRSISKYVNNIKSVFRVDNSFTDSGYYTCYGYLSATSGTRSEYVEDSDEAESDSVLIPYLVGIHSASLTVSQDADNDVKLTIDTREAKNTTDDGNFGDRLNIDFDFNVELKSAMQATFGNTVKSYNGSLSKINRLMNEDFKKLMTNLDSKSGFLPGLYYLEISTEAITYGGIYYEASQPYYVYKPSGSSYSSSLKEATVKSTINRNSSRAFNCSYYIGYTDWSYTDIKYVRNDMSNKGFVSHGEITNLLEDSAGNTLTFVNYSFKYMIHETRTYDETGLDTYETPYAEPVEGEDLRIELNMKKNLNVIDSWDKNKVLWNSSGTETEAGVSLTLRAKIQSNSSIQEYKEFIYLIGSGKLSNNMNKTLDQAGYVKEADSLLPLQQRLKAPILSDISSKDSPELLDVYRDFTVTWDYKGNQSLVEKFYIEGWQMYSGTWDVWSENHLDSGFNYLPGAGGIVTLGSYIISKVGDKVTVEKQNKSTRQDASKRSWKFRHQRNFGLWEYEYWDKNNDLIGFTEMKVIDVSQWKFFIKAISNTAEYGDSIYGDELATSKYENQKYY